MTSPLEARANVMAPGTSHYLNRELMNSLDFTSGGLVVHDQTLIQSKNIPQEQKETNKHTWKLAGCDGTLVISVLEAEVDKYQATQ